MFGCRLFLLARPRAQVLNSLMEVHSRAQVLNSLLKVHSRAQVLPPARVRLRGQARELQPAMMCLQEVERESACFRCFHSALVVELARAWAAELQQELAPARVTDKPVVEVVLVRHLEMELEWVFGLALE